MTGYADLFTVTLFTGMQQEEILGLKWDCVDFKTGTLTVNKQLTRPEQRKAGELFTTPKNGKPRTISPAPAVMAALKRQRARQGEMKLRAGSAWDNPHGFVFTDEIGRPLSQHWVEMRFSRLRDAAGLEGVRFHDLRHTYAVNSIRAGDDIKTIQSNLGHSSAAFTLDRYGHFTEQMKKDSAQRMEGFMKGVLGL